MVAMSLPRRASLRLVLAFALLAASAALPRAATAPPEAPVEKGSLAGQLLVASPEIGDPRFAKTVVLLVRQGKEGAFGIVINRPVEEKPIASVLEAIGQDAEGVRGTVRVFAGGPVEPEAGFVLHSGEYRRPETISIDGRVALTSSPEVLRDIGSGRGPKKSLVAFGYAGWAPGQLEAEIARHDWYTAPEDPSLVFDADRARLWDKAMAHRTLDL
jgi:putative transcriptional regulator